MTEVTLHATPRWRDVVLEQVRMVGLSLRREALIVLLVLAVASIPVLGELFYGNPGFDSEEPLFQTAIFSFLLPFAVWKRERRFGPDFLWTLPVDRRRLALAKVFAGGVWLTVVLAVFVAWLLALMLVSRASPALTVTRVPFIAAIAAYLFGSALVLGLRHPLRWLFGTVGVLFAMGMLSDRISRPDDSEWQYVPGARAFFSAVEDAHAVLRTLPPFAQWAIPTFLWLGAGLAALWIAASRHGERRR